MLEIARELAAWCREGRDFAVATVVAVRGSAPRPPGAALAVDAAGTALGSVSGGCVEGAVYELCQEALAEGAPRTGHFGYSDADAFAVGLTCGGALDVLVTPVRGDGPARPLLSAALECAAAGETAALARVVTGPAAAAGGALLVRGDGTAEGTLGGGRELDRTAAAEAAALLAAGRTGTVELGDAGGRCGEPVTLLVESSLPPPRMLVFGAVDFAAALAGAGSFLGYRVTVCDARAVFATPERFPAAAEVVVDWPHRYLDAQFAGPARPDGRTAVCVLTHDPKFDVPLLARALRLPLAYVGAMGSRRTHDDRLRRLREAGLTGAELARLRSPIGLDLGARTPEETALSIAAEIVALRRGGTGAPLTATSRPIHPRIPDATVGSAHDHGRPSDLPARAQPRAA
ncbi:XdhC/CoxI family protein [Streptomyces sp. DSM 44917]|uniref:XdhC/CoxI family protein n=1 Tax=Streptomyces boetiae TaxID=3075541 RepID=A0ABU2L2G1_9ACTN|nr:XdhC/CoxI family protein [Streptomyces sp. DSM 44917]MDT0305755.1 XdhC/CoxI family protein [Streptomyces sp. DSM 44917]